MVMVGFGITLVLVIVLAFIAGDLLTSSKRRKCSEGGPVSIVPGPEPETKFKTGRERLEEML